MDQSDDDEEDEEQDEDAVHAQTAPKAINKRDYTFIPHKIHHIPKDSVWGWQSFNYFANLSQYIVSNADQVRVKYIVQVKH